MKPRTYFQPPIPLATLVLTRAAGLHWSLLPFPACPVCAGSLAWFDCDLVYGCAECDDCGARYAVQVTDAADA